MAGQVKGMTRLIRQIEAISPAVAEQISAGIQVQGIVLLARVKTACAVPEIAANINFAPTTDESKKSGAPATASGKPLRFKLRAVQSKVGKRVYNPRWEEFGTRPHSLAKGASAKRGKKGRAGAMHPGAKARPFFWPTVRAWKPQIRRRIRADVKAALQAALRK